MQERATPKRRMRAEVEFMTVKEKAKHVIESLPEESSMDGVLHALYVHIKFTRGESEIRGGRGVPHGRARQRLKKWAR